MDDPNEIPSGYIRFQVDNVPVRTFKKYNDLPYPSSKPMTLHATLWDGSYWATQQGAVKIDWSQAPFVVNYRDYSSNGCVNNGGSSACPTGSNAWMNKELNSKELGTVAWAERNYMSYNYCADGWRFPQGFPAECSPGSAPLPSGSAPRSVPMPCLLDRHLINTDQWSEQSTARPERQGWAEDRYRDTLIP